MQKICFIIAYFGKFRADFAFWLKSVEHNPDVDFLLFTDQTLIKVPKNVTVVKTAKLDFTEMENFSARDTTISTEKHLGRMSHRTPLQNV